MAALGALRLSAQNNYTPETITTLAGNANSGGGYLDGTGANALFYNPNGVAVDGAGNVYVADTGNFVVRKIDTTGKVTTLAGSAGNSGAADGAGTSALFGPIKAIASDTAGNLYVSDWVTAQGSSGAIRKISPAGVVSTLVSGGLIQPLGLTLDGANNVYVADSGNFVIRKITPAGAVSVYAGTLAHSGTVDGGVGSGQFAFPTSVAFDGSGNLYVTDSADDTIRRVAAGGGAMTTFAGQPGVPAEIDGAVAASSFTHPVAIASDGAGNLYIVDDATVLREISASGTVTTLAGVPGVFGSLDGSGANAKFKQPAGIASTASGHIYIADTGNTTIRSGATVPVNVPPTIQFQPSGETVNNGAAAMLSITANGANLSYQWYFNDGTTNSPIAGATGSALTVSNISPLQAGSYSVVVSNAYGSVTSNPVTVGVQTLSRIVNLSTLATVGTGASSLVAGFVASGSASKQLLIRGAGPALSGFGVAAPLAAPVLTLFDKNSTTLATNSGWNNDPALSAAFTATGAFPYPANSLDSAMLKILAPAQYTASIVGANNTTGTALVEIYDDDGSNGTSQLINISSRDQVTPASPLTAGFVINGNTPMTVLIRAIGPTLSSFGISTPLDSTSLTLYDSGGNVMQSNRGWGGTATLASAFARVFAFGLPSNSLDSALLVTLQPGSYTASAASADGSSGIALVEVYEVK